MKTSKAKYEAPCLEIIPMEVEGVIADSSAGGGGTIPTMPGVEVNSSSVYNSSDVDGLESMIEDILTIE